MSPDSAEVKIVRPGQFRRGGFGTGIAALRDRYAVMQVNTRLEGPFHRVKLGQGDSAEIDGWQLELIDIDNTGRGAVRLRITPPDDALTDRPGSANATHS